MLRMNFVIMVAIILMIALVEMACGQTVIDFTAGIPAGVEPKQANGSLVYYPSYKCCHVYGEWMLPWEIQQGERVEIDLNPRYETAGGVIVNGAKKAVTRYTVSPVVITATGTVGLYGGSTSLANRAQWQQVRYWPNPTPTPTETPTETATETPTATATPTIDYGNWWPVWRIVKNSQDVLVFEKWLVPPGVTMVRVESGNAVAGEGE